LKSFFQVQISQPLIPIAFCIFPAEKENAVPFTISRVVFLLKFNRSPSRAVFLPKIPSPPFRAPINSSSLQSPNDLPPNSRRRSSLLPAAPTHRYHQLLLFKPPPPVRRLLPRWPVRSKRSGTLSFFPGMVSGLEPSFLSSFPELPGLSVILKELFTSF